MPVLPKAGHGPRVAIDRERILAVHTLEELIFLFAELVEQLNTERIDEEQSFERQTVDVDASFGRNWLDI